MWAELFYNYTHENSRKHCPEIFEQAQDLFIAYIGAIKYLVQ